MGEKGRWFSGLKRFFSSKSTQNSASRKSSNEKKKKRRKDSGKFELPFPSDELTSIERILEEAEREHNLIFRPPSSLEDSAKPPSPVVTTSYTTSHPRSSPPPPPPLPPRLPLSSKLKIPEASPELENASASKIQAVYRGFMARKSFRSLKGLVRLQGVVKGQNVKRQTLTAMKYMQLLVRLQAQVQARRIHGRHDPQSKEIEKWGLAAEAINVDWDDSQLTKEEIEARIKRKANAIMRRQRVMAYTYSNQKWRQPAITQPRQDCNFEMKWLNWLDRQLVPTNPTESRPKKNLRQPRPKKNLYTDIDSPRSTKSAAPAFLSSRQAPTPMSRTLAVKNNSTRLRGTESPGNLSLKDDASLTSCPPYMARTYQATTVSAAAKGRSNSNPKERSEASLGGENRRLSFPTVRKYINQLA